MRTSRTALGVLLLLLAASPLLAFVPSAARIEQAIARTNVAAGRDKALRLELSLKIGDRVGVASGELISHPTGLARLELHGAGNLVERHLLQGSELTVGRNGEILTEHRSFLPPFFFLQAESPTTLRNALASFDVLVDIVGLSQCGDTDCYVLGDPSREIERPPMPEVAGLDIAYGDGEEGLDEVDDLASGLTFVDAPAEPAADGYGAASEEALASDVVGFQADIWPKVFIETGSYEVKGFENGTGVRILLGPIADFGNLRVPSWILIEEPDREPARLDVMRASQVAAPLSIFEREWIDSPASWSDLGGPGGAPTP